MPCWKINAACFWAHQNDPSSVAKKAAFTNMRNTVQAKLRSMQDTWLSAKADGYMLIDMTQRGSMMH
ncbi:hypothetical protein ACOMHN_028336 [Nucella lapillus]